ncbi:MAG: CHAT domain-containing protein [Bacteroidetes bacterium]|nr:CHAT domain-containing protein [Bacteroidota bacterium]
MKNILLIPILFFSIHIYAQENEKVHVQQNVEQATIYYEKGLNFGKAGKLDSALFFTEQALHILEGTKTKESTLLANTYQSLGIISRHLGKFDDALKYYDQSEIIYKQNKQKNLLAYLYSNKSIILKAQNNYVKANDYLMQAITIFNQDSIKFKDQLANSYNNLGNIYSNQRKYDEAIKFYKKSLALKGESKKSYSTYGNLALSYKELKDLKLAETYHLKAIHIAIEYYKDTNNLNIAKHYMNYANILALQEENQRSLKYFRKAHTIYKENFGNVHPDISTLYLNIGEYYTKLNQLDSALWYYQKSLRAISPAFTATEFSANPDINQVLSKTHFLRSLKNKANVLNKLGEQSNKQTYYTASLQTYDLAIETIDKIRSGYISEESKLFLAENEFETYSQALQVCNKLYTLTNESKYIEKAFHYSEAGKSAILTEALKNTEALNIGGIPDSLLNKERELEKGIWNYEELIYEENKKKNPDENRLQYWNKYLFELKLEYDALMEYLEKEYPKYLTLKQSDNNIDLDQVQNHLHNNELMIEYFYSDSSIYSIVIGKHKWDLLEIKIDEQFEKNLDKLLAALSNNNFSNHGFKEFNDYHASSYYIYSKILKPFEDQIENKNLIIIPDGKLAYLPFEVLTTNNKPFKKINYRELPYLLHKTLCSYSYSAQFLVENQSLKMNAHKKLGAFAPTYNNLDSLPKDYIVSRQEYREKLFPLKGIKIEVERIAELLNGDAYIDLDANEKTFKKVAADYDILHLAMHTIMDDENPMYSKMAFTQQNDSVEDGFLNTYELYNMQLNSRMAVLSSCNSGSGKLRRGEGVMSLARGFVYSGCPSIIMTLWSVEDNSGVQLMTSFYKYLLEGKTKSEAIQQSKIDFIQHSDQLKAHPYFWSGYVVIGNNSALFRSGNLLFILSGILVFLISAFIFRKRIQNLFH